MIAEILDEDESRVRWSHDNGKTWEYADIDELIAVYERSKSMSKWIPVSERLPEAKYGESARLLVTKCWKEDEDTQFVDEAYFNGSCWCEPTGECITYAKVVAWMPLPEPYKGE